MICRVPDLFDLRTFGSTFVTLVVIMDPVGAVPVFLALTSTMTAARRRRAALQAVVAAGLIIVVFAIFGRGILAYLHISLPALQAAGGLVLLLVALQLLTGGTEDPANAARYANVALVPLAIPLIAGPGAIVATMVYVQQASGLAEHVGLWSGIVLVMVCLWAAMRFSGLIHRLIGQGGLTLVTRVSGLLLSAIAVQMLADSVHEFVVGWS